MAWVYLDVTFSPNRVRHATRSILDPRQAHRAGIFRAVLPIAAGVASQQDDGSSEGPGLLGGLRAR